MFKIRRILYFNEKIIKNSTLLTFNDVPKYLILLPTLRTFKN